ncbi:MULTISPECIES: BON domain-containing protein [unclassified Variovorax]|uniref:BON domain-containing protein n=1 Tax=unclassified Variovorax TaxID=663243 RepID=UPI001315C9FF|nr:MULTISPECIES: BON domain-containing protein [unclassified Variovorax]VTU18047.1 putative periplasmic or secreted lipoprotein [Variovorax sp. SRS16]VTU22154.1 putative periplasmic or secreted lipoprotein [Variovorax sp. PBL-E5]
MNPDIELRHEVLAALNWDPQACCADVDVCVEDGAVTLTGQLVSIDLKRAVECAVRRVKGIKTLVNELVVRGVPEPCRRDSDSASAGGVGQLEAGAA